MTGSAKKGMPILEPRLQIRFFYTLKALRELYFGKALSKTVKSLDIEDINKELGAYVKKESVSKVAEFGLRGEVVFPVPCVLGANPSLLGYYRLLYGLSQKEFYSKGPFGRFKCLEEKGDLPERLTPDIACLCRSLAGTGEKLIDGIDRLSRDIVDDLQLLTLGPQLRGSENTRLGKDATSQVFDLVHAIVKPYVEKADNCKIHIKNDSRRTVLIEFASDPDISMTEQTDSGDRLLVAVEIKGGTDVSNIHNRLGEAEKSHQKARGKGFFEFWTILRVEVDEKTAKKESPTTTRFFHLDKIGVRASEHHKEFKAMLSSVLSIQAI